MKQREFVVPSKFGACHRNAGSLNLGSGDVTVDSETLTGPQSGILGSDRWRSYADD